MVWVLSVRRSGVGARSRLGMDGCVPVLPVTGWVGGIVVIWRSHDGTMAEHIAMFTLVDQHSAYGWLQDYTDSLLHELCSIPFRTKLEVLASPWGSPEK